jgi:hypothetical protein
MAVLSVKTLSSWREIVEAFTYLGNYAWVFRGQERPDWRLQTSLEREFGCPVPDDVERKLFWHFVRTASRLLPPQLVPEEHHVEAWLGLIQHYGGPTRFLDVTASPYVALFFAFESAGENDRAVWAIDEAWCMDESARIMADAESIPKAKTFDRTTAGQRGLVYSLVHGTRWPTELFQTFRPFTGVFPVAPFKPDVRQIAQQARFLCAANPALSFVDNLKPLRQATNAMYCLVLPASLRVEMLDRLAEMNVSAATLFPDLIGLARSLRTHSIRRPKGIEPKPVCLSEPHESR